MTQAQTTTRTQSPEAVTGVQLAQGIGHRPTKGFWGEAWDYVVRRPGAIFGLAWLGVIAFFAVFAPVIASGHPIMVRGLGEGGRTTWPLFASLTATDWMLLIGTVFGTVWLLVPAGVDRSTRLGVLVVLAIQAGLAVVIVGGIEAAVTGRDVSDAVRKLEQAWIFPYLVSAVVALLTGAATFWFVPFESIMARLGAVGATALVVGVVTTATWGGAIPRFDYNRRQAAGEISAIRTLIPLSPQQGDTTLNLRPPGSNLLEPAIRRITQSTLVKARVKALEPDVVGPGDPLALVPLDGEILELAEREIRSQSEILPRSPDSIVEGLHAAGLTSVADLASWLHDVPVDRFYLGTDSLGQDVLSQMMHACRLSISIGLVSTAIAVAIGVTVGALMGYFGGWVDLVLYRVVEVFMAIPVLFLLIVAAAVLPRNTYVMMIIIGCVSWTGSARFVRAEFYKLRNQDFVQSARAVGLPLRSILFKHMLPNGVTPVLVDSSFAIAAAILAEAVLSYLGLGPANQASWGRLLSDATNQVGDFIWWLAIFPGAAIFLTVLSYNLIGEALRDAIDPKLKKARV